MRATRNYGINLTPLIDVVFIVLAFLLVYSRLDPPQAVEVSLPRVSGEEVTEGWPANVLSLTANGALYLDGKPLTEEALREALPTLPESASLELRSDRDASAEALIRLMRILSESGVKATQISVGGEKAE